MKKSFLIILSYLLSLTAFSNIETLSKSVQTFHPEEAEYDSLVEFRLETLKKKVTLKFDPLHPSYQTDTRMIVKTREVDQVEDYAIVQFIKGCIFKSRKENGEVIKEVSSGRTQLGKYRRLKYSEFEIDADGFDPVYTDLDGKRFGLYRTNSRGTTDLEISNWYSNSNIVAPFVFATDLPGQGTLFVNDIDTEGTAQNPSLEFKTCLYKNEDVPRDIRTGDFDSSRAIKCFSWDHKFTYDFKTKTFSSPKEIDPTCFE